MLYPLSYSPKKFNLARPTFHFTSPRFSPILIFYAIAALFLGMGCGPSSDLQYVIGFSQSNLDEPWRQATNDAASTEVAKHPDMQIIFKDAESRSDLQINQAMELLQMGIDLLLISPHETASLTPIVEQAFDSGIPVIVMDCAVNTEKYTCYIGVNDREIGRLAGLFAAETLGDGGKIVEIRGQPGSTIALERSVGFREAIDRYVGIKIVDDLVADRSQTETIDRLRNVFKKNSRVDLVFAHDYTMALWARSAAEEVGRASEMVLIGCDSVGREGVVSVCKQRLDATVWRPNSGEIAIQIARQALRGEKVPRRIELPTALIACDNADEWLERL